MGPSSLFPLLQDSPETTMATPGNVGGAHRAAMRDRAGPGPAPSCLFYLSRNHRVSFGWDRGPPGSRYAATGSAVGTTAPPGGLARLEHPSEGGKRRAESREQKETAHESHPPAALAAAGNAGRPIDTNWDRDRHGARQGSRQGGLRALEPAVLRGDNALERSRPREHRPPPHAAAGEPV
jgi:hypothetical protein